MQSPLISHLVDMLALVEFRVPLNVLEQPVLLLTEDLLLDFLYELLVISFRIVDELMKILHLSNEFHPLVNYSDVLRIHWSSQDLMNLGLFIIH
jgi:hypothetical protein